MPSHLKDLPPYLVHCPYLAPSLPRASRLQALKISLANGSTICALLYRLDAGEEEEEEEEEEKEEVQRPMDSFYAGVFVFGAQPKRCGPREAAAGSESSTCLLLRRIVWTNLRSRK